VVIGAAYAVVVGAAYVIVVAGAAKYEGMTAEGAASGINAGSNGATSTSGSAAAGAGAGAAFFFLVALFLDFLAEAAAAIPTQKHNSASKSAHAMTGMYDPDEPESTEAELAWEPEESPEVNESREPEVREFMDADESPLEPEDESHGVTVVVGATVTISFAAIFGAATSTALPSDSGSGVVTNAPATPAAIAAAPAVAPTPMPIFCANVSSFLAGAAGAPGATVAQGLPAAARPRRLTKTTM